MRTRIAIIDRASPSITGSVISVGESAGNGEACENRFKISDLHLLKFFVTVQRKKMHLR